MGLAVNHPRANSPYQRTTLVGGRYVPLPGNPSSREGLTMSLTELKQRVLSTLEAEPRSSDPAFAATLTATPADLDRKLCRFQPPWHSRS